MQQRVAGNAAPILIALLTGIVLATVDVVVLLTAVKGTVTAASLAAVFALYPSSVVGLVVAPLTGTIILALLLGRMQTAAPPALVETKIQPPKPTPPAPPSPAPALRLLALLQQEGRFIDFIQEDIDSYSDGQVGAAVRSIHAGCRKALRERIELQRIIGDDDGSEVVVQPGFDPAAIRLTGNVAGAPPFRGSLQHGGWRATKVSLPQTPGGGESDVIAPAEVEIG